MNIELHDKRSSHVPTADASDVVIQIDNNSSLSGESGRVSPSTQKRYNYSRTVDQLREVLQPINVWEYSSDSDDGYTYVDRNGVKYACTSQSKFLHEKYDAYLHEHPEFRAQQDEMNVNASEVLHNRSYERDWVPRELKDSRPKYEPNQTRQQYYQKQRLLSLHNSRARREVQKQQQLVEMQRDPAQQYSSMVYKASERVHQDEIQEQRKLRRLQREKRTWEYNYGKDAPLPNQQKAQFDMQSAGGGQPIAPQGALSGLVARWQNRPGQPVCSGWQACLLATFSLLSAMVLISIVGSSFSHAFIMPKLFYTCLLLGSSLIILALVKIVATCCASLDVLQFVGAMQVICSVLAFFVTLSGYLGIARSHVSNDPTSLEYHAKDTVYQLLFVLSIVTVMHLIFAYLTFTRAHVWLSPYTQFQNEEDIIVERKSMEELIEEQALPYKLNMHHIQDSNNNK